MLNQLLETKQATQRKAGGTLVSVVLHVVLIAGAIQLTERVVIALPKPEETRVQFQPVQPDVVKPRETPARDAIARQPAQPGFTVLRAPTVTPVDIPAIDLSASPTDAAKFMGVVAPGGTQDGVVGAPKVPDGQPFTEIDVDKAAAALPGSARPAYPDMLKASGVEGEALVQFVVDTLGRAEPGTFSVLEATHDAFGGSVQATLSRMRFLPAEAGGRKVRMLVRQRFAFTLER